MNWVSLLVCYAVGWLLFVVCFVPYMRWRSYIGRDEGAGIFTYALVIIPLGAAWPVFVAFEVFILLYGHLWRTR